MLYNVTIQLVGGEDKDGKPLVHQEEPFSFDEKTTFKQLQSHIDSTFQIDSAHQHIFHNDKRMGLGTSVDDTLVAIGFGNAHIKHSKLDTWALYHKTVKQIIGPARLCNREDLIAVAQGYHQRLKTSGFYQVYENYGGDSARDHFMVQHVLKGGSIGDFYFEHKPKETNGTRCGVLCYLKPEHDDVPDFQVKTDHRGGSSLSKDSITGPDIREMFNYKLLELIGVGPEVQFVASSNKESKTAAYICTRWRTDFVELNKLDAADLNVDALEQLHLLQIILSIEDMHGENVGQWKDTKKAAIVDFNMGIERRGPKALFCKQYNDRLAWNGNVLTALKRKKSMELAKRWLEEWNFEENVDNAYADLVGVKNRFKESHDTRFKGLDGEDPANLYTFQVTNDLLDYIEKIKKSAKIFLSH
ncbi:hypothetical protein M3Y96_00687200 [Aphelenchoides besseyi]|nr:hypothetical protein M3Y96_00687200 [Aphelenchoides besseyi]